MIYNNDYIKTLTQLRINNKVIDKNYNKFLKEYSLDDLKNKNAWRNMIEIIICFKFINY